MSNLTLKDVSASALATLEALRKIVEDNLCDKRVQCTQVDSRFYRRECIVTEARIDAYCGIVLKLRHFGARKDTDITAWVPASYCELMNENGFYRLPVNGERPLS